MACCPDGGKTMDAGNLADAKRECDASGSTSGMFYDVCGNGDTFVLCAKGDVQVKSGGGSSLYNKDNLGCM